MGDIQKREMEFLRRLTQKRARRELPAIRRTVLRVLQHRRNVIIETGSEKDHPVDLIIPAVLRVRRGKPGLQAVIVTPNSEHIAQATRLLQEHWKGVKGPKPSVVPLSTSGSARQEAGEVSKKPTVVVSTTERLIDHIRRDNIDLSRVHLCVIEEPEDAEEAAPFNADVEYILSKLPATPQTVVFSKEHHDGVQELAGIMRRPALVPAESWQGADRYGDGSRQKHKQRQERLTVSNAHLKKLSKNEALKQKVESILKDIHEDENPDELNAYRKFIMKNVPFFRRGYFAAYLLKYSDTTKQADRDQRKSTFTSVFVGIGKNRRVFPRDLVGLMTDVDGVDADDIGQVKILDNYSFVEVANDKADKVIGALNGKDYRGRRLTVNYARKKD